MAIPPLERMSEGRRRGPEKIAAITRYVTVALGLIQGTAYYFFLKNSGIITQSISEAGGFSMVFAAIVIIAVFTAGTALIMWMGEQINQKGVGNGSRSCCLRVSSPGCR